MAGRKDDFLKGIKIAELASMDYARFMAMKTEQRRQVVLRMASAGNKRLKALEAAGATGETYRTATKTSERFGTSGKTTRQLTSEFKRLQKFLTAQQSTVRGYKKAPDMPKRRTPIRSGGTPRGKGWKTLSDISMDDFMKMDYRTLKAAVDKLGKEANRRLVEFEKRKQKSPAYRNMEKSGGHVNSDYDTLNALRVEFMRAKNFLAMETSTLEGYEAVIARTIETMAKRGVEMTREQFEDFWDVYEKLKEIHPSISNEMLKYRIFKEITAEINSNEPKTVDEIIEKMQSELGTIYQKMADELAKQEEEDWKELEEGGITEEDGVPF